MACEKSGWAPYPPRLSLVDPCISTLLATHISARLSDTGRAESFGCSVSKNLPFSSVAAVYQEWIEKMSRCRELAEVMNTPKLAHMCSSIHRISLDRVVISEDVRLL